jgi:uncharacterized protein YbjT (DUF2867 family)
MIVITAPTSNIGSQVLQLLLDRDQELRVVARDPNRLPEAVRARVDVVAGSHGDPDVVDRALTDADALFWLVPPNPRAPTVHDAYVEFTRPAAKALTAHDVQHVVSISALGRGTPFADRAGLVTASLATSDLIASTGVAARALACPGFMDNVLRAVPSIRDHGVITDVADADRVAPLTATRDIAAVAARLLLDRTWTGTGDVPILGPEDLSPNDQARVVGEVLGRPVRYQRQSPEDLRAAFTAHGVGEAFQDGYLEMMRAKDDGLDAGVPRTPENTTPTSFRTWCEQVLRPAVLG